MAESERTTERSAGSTPGLKPPAGRSGFSALERDSGLTALQLGLLRHYFRLEEAERRLSTMVSRERSAGRAVRQLEMERGRLGRDLHTGVGQMLAAIRLQAELIDGQIATPTPPVRQALDRILKLVQDAMQQVRALSRRLHPPEWQRLGIASAIRELWEISGIPQRFQASLRIGDVPREPGLEGKTVIYRATQEALSNISQHARPTHVNATLEAQGNALVLTVFDDGPGFDAAAVMSAPPSLKTGIGLRSIREQASGLGGSLSIESGPLGTTLRVTVPYSPLGA